MTPRNFPYSTALVTGVSSGIGHAIAKALVAEGVTVYGVTRRPRELNLEGVTLLEADLSEPESVRTLIGQLSPIMSTLDLLVNNAGCGVFGYVDEQTEDDVMRQMRLMLEAPILLARMCLEPMLARRHGCIVNISSLAARLPIPCMAIYNTTKAGLSAFSHSLCEETQGSGIQVLDLQPGDFQTGFNRNCLRRGGSDSVWNRVEETMAGSPPPQVAARKLIQLLHGKKTGQHTIGNFFQSRVAVWAQSVLPAPAMQALMRRYFRSDGR